MKKLSVSAAAQGGDSFIRVTDTEIFRRFFDTEWYLHTNPHVGDFPGTAAEHYLEQGCAERRSPHPFFDLDWYFDRHAEVNAAGSEPLCAYFGSGWRRLHAPHPMFDPAWYLLENADLLTADVDPLRHYIEGGWREGRTLHPLFDTKWYLETYPDVARTGQEPLRHFLMFGWLEGRRPHPLFDTEWYVTQNVDIKNAGVNPWLHYIQYGWCEGRSPHPRFNAAWYLNSYLSSVDPQDEPLAHYLAQGWREGLRPTAEFKKPKISDADSVAPLLQAEMQILSQKQPGLAINLATDETRGTLVMVLHETEVGGAPHVLKQFAQWVRDHTRFGVRLVSLTGGNLRDSFAQVGPLLVLSDLPEESRIGVLKDWLGPDVRGVFLNSIASGKFLRYMPPDLPTIAFVHELPQVLELFPEEVALVRNTVQRVICGGPEVTRALHERYDFAQDMLVSAHSFIEALPKEADPAERRTTARKALGVADDRILVMGCGVLHWRKSPETFIAVAENILARGIDAEFVWLGGGPDHAACEALVAEKGLEGRVRFTGYEPTVADKLAAGDIFVLSSKEDPFPLVALYAAQSGMPIVCFQDAGGIVGFVAQGSGSAVAYMDDAAMADAVANYALDSKRRAAAGMVGRAQVARAHTIDVIGPLLLHHLREVAGLSPEVSVVLPNYNYEAYLPERLASIADQTFQDFEVILLDDASSDNSVGLLEDFAAMRPGTRLVANDVNSGSPFVQWMRGMDMARSDIIWLAEADDYCEPDLMGTLLPLFDDHNMRLASCMSVPVQSDGTVIGDYRPIYLDRIAPGRFDNDFIVTDHEEANHGLGVANTIPNASGVMFRRFDPEPEFAEKITAMRLCGDWFFYTRAMKGGLVGFSAAPLNYHRRHGGTVTHKLEGSLRYFGELADVRAYLGRTYHQNTAARAQIKQFLAQDIARFNIENPASLPHAPTPKKALPSLAVIAPDLSPGGGQIFSISLANEWVGRGGRAVLLNAGSQPTHPAVVAKLDSAVALYHTGDPGSDLDEIVRRYDIDIVHSSIWWADALVDNYRERLPHDIPWVITMHGCHETFIKHPDIDKTFPERMTRMLERASTWVYTAEKNLAIFDKYARPKKLLRIPNGRREEPIRHTLERSALGLRDDAMVLCLASRAIPSKGWREAIELTHLLNDQGHKVDLILIGEGPSADAARAQAPANVLLMGQVSNLQDYLAIADVGLLPSYFVGESLPLVLIEMMAKSLPLIATNIGETPDIIGAGGDAAGILVPLKDEGLDTEALIVATKKMLDPDVRKQFALNARKRFDANFRLDRMVDRYAEVYEDVSVGKRCSG